MTSTKTSGWAWPGWAWLLLYCALIVVFAKLYESMPGEFYHSTLTREPEYHHERQRLILALHDALLDTTRITPVTLPFATGEAHGWFAISDLKMTEDGACVLTVGVPVLLDKPRAFLGLSYRVTFDANAFFADREKRHLHSSDSDVWIVGYSAEPLSPPGAPQDLVGRIWKHPGAEASWPTIGFPSSVVDQIASFREATGGKVDRFPGGFWRAVYLSAVTITTLGYGDVVPLTRNARLAIAAEAVLGILVIGFYLNGLVVRTRGERQAP